MTDDLFETLQTLQAERRQDIKAGRREAGWRMGVIFVLFMVFVVVLDYIVAFLPNPPSPSVVTIQNVRAIGPTALCPGDTLRFSYEITGNEQGVLDVDHAIWRRTPPQTVVFSTARRVILIEPINYQRADAFRLATDMVDPLSLQPIVWTEGEYEHRIAISTPSRNTTPAIVSLPFEIRSDCP